MQMRNARGSRHVKITGVKAENVKKILIVWTKRSHIVAHLPDMSVWNAGMISTASRNQMEDG